jgi:serine/threonine protein kinase
VRSSGNAGQEWSPEGDVLGGIDLEGYRDFVAVARGGDSVVYRARQNGLDRYVAVKVLLLDEPAAVARFQRELEITVRLGRQHPHIVTVLDTGVTTAGQLCIVMEYYDLGSLHDRLRAHGPLAADEVVTAGTLVADALAFAHAQGVLHRDVKPQNILVLPTSYVLADFGIARRVDAGHSASLERFSYRHAAPQVLDGASPTVADDVWSLGSTMFTLLDGRPPFAADDPAEDTALAYLRRVRTDQPRALSRTDLPLGLAAVIARCLEKDPADRYPDAVGLGEALADVQSEARAWAPPPQKAAPSPSTQPIPSAPPPVASAPVEHTPTAAPPPIAPLVAPLPVSMSPVSTSAPSTPPASGAPVFALPASTVDGDAWAPPVVRPAVAPSALVHLDTGDQRPLPVAPDPEATGSPEPEAPDEPSQDATRDGVRWRRLAILATVAVLLGAGIGLGGTWLLSLGGTARPTSSSTPLTQDGRPVGTFSGPVPSGTGPPQPDVGDPRLAPVIIGAQDQGTSVVLTWRDPTDGQATFIVVQVVGSTANALRQLAPGTTHTTVDGLDPTAAQYCFAVVALVGQDRAASATRCVTRTK